MFTAVVVRMPNDDDEVLAKFQKFDTSQQQQYVDLNQAARQESEGGGWGTLLPVAPHLLCPVRTSAIFVIWQEPPAVSTFSFSIY